LELQTGLLQTQIYRHHKLDGNPEYFRLLHVSTLNSKELREQRDTVKVFEYVKEPLFQAL
jgi:hypothetical protein